MKEREEEQGLDLSILSLDILVGYHSRDVQQIGKN